MKSLQFLLCFANSIDVCRINDVNISVNVIYLVVFRQITF